MIGNKQIYPDFRFCHMATPSISISFSRLYRKGKPLSGTGHSPLATSTVKAGRPYLSMNQSFNPAALADRSGSPRAYPEDIDSISAMMCAMGGVKFL